MQNDKFPSARLALICLLMMSVTSCKTTDISLKGESDSKSEYNLFWDQGDHLKELIQAKHFDAAEKLYQTENAFFLEDFQKFSPDLKIIADSLNLKKTPPLRDSIAELKKITWPAPAAQWVQIKDVLQSAKLHLENYSASVLLSRKEFTATEFLDLKKDVSALSETISKSAPRLFSEYDVLHSASFVSSFPVKIELADLLAEDLQPIRKLLLAAQPKDIESFSKNYPETTIGESRWRSLGNIFLESLIKNSGDQKKPDLASALKALDGAKALGFSPNKIAGINITFVEVTSQTLLKHGQIAFPAEVDVDLPLSVEKAQLDKVLNGASASSADYVIIFDVALAKAERRIATKTSHDSRYVAGYQTQPNPEYNLAQNKVNAAQGALNAAQMNKISIDSQFCYGAGCFGKALQQIAAGIQTGKARDEIQEAMAALQSTSMTREVPVYQPYKFDVAKIQGTKTMTVHYYVIDRGNSSYFKSTFDIQEKNTFQTVFSVNEKDPDRDGIQARYTSEKDVSAWEDKPSVIKLSQLSAHYIAKRSTSKPLPGLATLRAEMLRDKNAALAAYKENNYEAKSLNDSRFDNVVVVLVPDKKSLGSGFYVTPDVVLTNWHVVENSSFVEMRTYDGQETFGKVIAQDVMRDLALVRVQKRGRPVTFYSKTDLPLGQTVEAIGHPQGLDFSITRGVISAIRRENPTTLPGGSRKSVLFIQTDAPINPGNSGGPLFLGNQVIGVNTQKLRRAEALNFAVHYSEVKTFLTESLGASY